MALELEQTLDTGVVGNYWKIDTWNYNAIAQTVKVGFGLYINSTIANNGSKAVKMKHMNFNGVLKEDMDNNAIGKLYALAKLSVLDDNENETNVFTTALDV